VSDRVSAFDFILGTIPFRGQVLNQIAAWWFQKLEGVVPHHFVRMPDPNISLVKNAKPLPVEIIVRGYLTGSTKTSSWYAYEHLNREICGLTMPAGMKKNQVFAAPIITPTTKPTVGHDEPVSREQIIERGLVSEKIYAQAEKYALKMFALGQKVAKERGLILVDTKYEMGLDDAGNLMVIDEVHTPDSSRYWIAETYEERFKAGKEPDSLDKEFVRRMLIDNGINISADPSTYDGTKFLDDPLRMAASEKYIQLYEKVTGEKFQFPEDLDGQERIEKVLKSL
jgi:phosphoribosylaminoimidazole-succinocarboxamide synthase